MRKFWGMFFAVAMVSIMIPTYAGTTLYQRGDLKVAIEESTTGVYYEVRQGDWQAVEFMPLIQYRSLNLDVGVANRLNRVLDCPPSPFLGISTDVSPLNEILKGLIAGGWKNITGETINLDGSITTAVGAGVSCDTTNPTITNKDLGFGVYAGVLVKF